MRHDTEELGGYETRLLAELTQVVQTRTEPRRTWFTLPKLAIAGTALAVLAVTTAFAIPLLGSAGERSPNTPAVADPAPSTATSDAQSPGDMVPVGFSLAVKGDDITVTVTDIKDDKALEAALKKEGVNAQVTVLDGVYYDCVWPEHKPGRNLSGFGAEPLPDGGMTFHLKRKDWADGLVLLVSVYTARSDDGKETRLWFGSTVAGSDPGECVGIQKP